MQWVQLLSIAVLMIRSSPTKWTGISPFEVLFGHPSPHLVKGIRGELKEIGYHTWRQQMKVLRVTLKNR
jgi:hypothetical protein